MEKVLKINTENDEILQLKKELHDVKVSFIMYNISDEFKVKHRKNISNDG